MHVNTFGLPAKAKGTHRKSGCKGIGLGFLYAGSTQQHWPFPDSHVDLGYAYLFTHPGNPTIFWDHYFDNGYKVQLNTVPLLPPGEHPLAESDNRNLVIVT